MSFSVTNMSKRTPPPQEAGIAKNRGIPGPRQDEKCVALVPQALTRAFFAGTIATAPVAQNRGEKAPRGREARSDWNSKSLTNFGGFEPHKWNADA